MQLDPVVDRQGVVHRRLYQRVMKAVPRQWTSRDQSSSGGGLEGGGDGDLRSAKHGTQRQLPEVPPQNRGGLQGPAGLVR
jgi:hypothetical protein